MLKTMTLLFACLSYTFISAQDIGDIQKGKLNYYNDVYHGRPTASGEIYDKTKVSAAHKDLPMKTMVEVINLTNNKSIFVEINDRTPQGSDAILELSRAAAEQLDFINDGITDGQIRIIQVLKPTTTVSKLKKTITPKEETKNIKQSIQGPKEMVFSEKAGITDIEKVKKLVEQKKAEQAKQATSKIIARGSKEVKKINEEISLEEAIKIGEKKFGIQLGAYKEKNSLNEALIQAKKEGMNLKVDLFVLSENTDSGVLYKLIYGYFAEDFARNKLEKLKQSFKDSFLKKF